MQRSNPANLNYKAINYYNKGPDTAFNHIFQNHIIGGAPKSIYAERPGSAASAVGNMYQLNALTLTPRTLVQPSVNGIAVLSTTKLLARSLAALSPMAT